MGMLCFGLVVMFCQPQKSVPAPAASYCEISRPITWSAADSRVTKEQIDTHNRVWKRLCATGTKK